MRIPLQEGASPRPDGYTWSNRFPGHDSGDASQGRPHLLHIRSLVATLLVQEQVNVRVPSQEIEAADFRGAKGDHAGRLILAESLARNCPMFNHADRPCRRDRIREHRLSSRAIRLSNRP